MLVSPGGKIHTSVSSLLGELHQHRDNPEGYIHQITGNLHIRKEEKDKFGEVFTPNHLINDMLDKLPIEIWSNPDNKWLDPATGFGNFQMVVYARLMRGLEGVIPDPAVRSEHIIRNMIFMVEFNQNNCKIVEKIFGTASNLCCSSFLEPFVFTGVPSTQQYNVIVGNPPFNADQKHEGKKGGGTNLWPLFVEKSLDMMLAVNGYLVFVHPALWRKPPSDRARTLFDKMVHTNYMSYLELHSKSDGKRDFNAQTPYDYYCIQKITPRTPGLSVTTVKDREGKHHHLDLSRWNFLPNHSFELIQQLITQDIEQSAVIFHRSQFGTDKKWVKAEKDETHQYPLIHSTPIGGPRIYWSSTKNQPHIPMFGVPKVIFGESGVNEAIIDMTGEYGMTQGAIGLKIQEPREVNGPLLKHALESELFAHILSAMSFSNFRIDWRMFLYFKPDFYMLPIFKDSPKIIKQCKRTASGRCEDEDEDEDEDEGRHSIMSSMRMIQSRPSRKSPSVSRRRVSNETTKSKRSPGNKSSQRGGISRRRKRSFKRRKYYTRRK